ncbi:MAG: winged helix-turn-helix transcriptional regulator [Trueperella sp.]|nr:winged helix-turn-helix transcriptional regulator [Trueperella sp.]
MSEAGTCEQILRLIIERGPITAGELAKILVLTPAAVRRHTSTLVADGYIKDHEAPSLGPVRRGRPARRFVATAAGQEQLGQGYSDLATHAMRFLQENMGEAGVEEFIALRTASLEKRYGAILARAGDNIADRAAALTMVLNREGYAASLRRGGPNAMSVQLCQGHCPVLEVAENFPLLCEAETEAFGRLLGVQIQRLSTLANGEHVCTTNIPLGLPKNLRKTNPRLTGVDRSSEGN